MLTKTRLITETIKDRIGGRILNDKHDLLAGHLAADIRVALEARGVLVFPQIGSQLTTGSRAAPRSIKKNIS